MKYVANSKKNLVNLWYLFMWTVTYRACVIDSLGLGITCVYVSYITVLCVRSCFLCFLCHPYILHSNLYIYLSPPIIKLLNLLIILVQVSSNATSSKKYTSGSLDYSCTCTQDKCKYTGCIGYLLANTIHCISSKKGTVMVCCFASTHHTFPAWSDR